MRDTITESPSHNRLALKQRNAKDAKTSVVECYTGSLNGAGGDDSVGAVSVGQTFETQCYPSQTLSLYSDSNNKKRC